MIEIEFRAWDTKNKVMIYEDEYASSHHWMTWTGRVYKNGLLLPYIMMQFTGIYDKNSKEIYEGDIVRIIDWPQKWSVSFLVIEYWQDLAYWGLKRFKIVNPECIYTGEIVRGGFEFQRIMDKKYEVIGNIYENPELLEEIK